MGVPPRQTVSSKSVELLMAVLLLPLDIAQDYPNQQYLTLFESDYCGFGPNATVQSVPDMFPTHVGYNAHSVDARGTWLFYGDTNYHGAVQPLVDALGGCYDINRELVGKVASLRYAGNLNNYRADTITLYAEINFQDEQQLIQKDTDPVHVNPKSLIITGKSFWTVYYDQEIGPPAECYKPWEGTRLLPDVTNEDYGPVYAVRKGCYPLDFDDDEDRAN